MCYAYLALWDRATDIGNTTKWVAGLIASEAEKEKGGSIETEELWPGRWREREREREERGRSGEHQGLGAGSRHWGGMQGFTRRSTIAHSINPRGRGETDPPRHMWARIYKCLHPLRKRGEAVDPARYLQWAPEVNKMWTAFLRPASFPHHSPFTPLYSYLKDPGSKLFSLAHEPILRCTHSIQNGLSQYLKETDSEVVVIFMD